MNGSKKKYQRTYYERKRSLDQIAVYVFGRTEQFIADYARSSGVSEHELARRVAELFYRQTGGEELGPAGGVHEVRRASTPRGKTVEPMEVGSDARDRGTPVKHWTQLPENRVKMKRVMEKMKEAKSQGGGDKS